MAIIGVYPPQLDRFPIGLAMNKNLTLRMGNANHRRDIPHLVELAGTGAVDPSRVITEVEPLTDAPCAPWPSTVHASDVRAAARCSSRRLRAAAAQVGALRCESRAPPGQVTDRSAVPIGPATPPSRSMS